MPMIDRLSQLWRRLLFYVRRDRFDRELEEEMRFHLEMKVEENLAAGVSPEEARYSAQRQFGNQTLLQEVSREMWAVRSIETLFHDLRYGARMLMKKPGFTSIAVVTLALGIGANTAIFSVVNAMLLRPLPYDRPEQLVALYTASPTPGYPRDGLSEAEFIRLRQENRSFTELAGWHLIERATLRGVSEPERVAAPFCTANFFRTLGVKVTLGRDFNAEEEVEGKNKFVVLS